MKPVLGLTCNILRSWFLSGFSLFLHEHLGNALVKKKIYLALTKNIWGDF